jgi:hypothetical protein
MQVKYAVIRVQNSEVRNRKVTEVTCDCKNADKNKRKILGCHSRVVKLQVTWEAMPHHPANSYNYYKQLYSIFRVDSSIILS